MSNEIFVAFATQKGGIGKSTITALAASCLHNEQGYNVAVMDCDAPQHSIYGLREREMKLIDEGLYFKALACDHFRKIRKNAYPVIASNALDALDDAEKMLVEEAVKPDIVFFNMLRTLKSKGGGMEKYSLSLKTLFRERNASNCIPQWGQVHPQRVSARSCSLFHGCPHSVQMFVPSALFTA